MRVGTSVTNGVSGSVVGNVFQTGTLTITEAVPTRPALQGLPYQPVFVGREDQVDALLELLRPDSEGVAAVAVDGLGGIGKTALVVHAAKIARDRNWFPGGMLMIDMRGYGPEEQQVTPLAALKSVLTAVGVHADQIPEDIEGRARLWRTGLAEHGGAGERVLVVIDNVSSADQVLPLLPGDSEQGHRVLITSRHRLAGLPGTRLVTLPTLREEPATMLLALELGTSGGSDERVRGDRAATAELVRLCGGLPLALRTATVLLAADPGRPVRDLVAALKDEHHRLEELEAEGSVSVRAAFNLSYRQLDADSQRSLRLLAVNPGPQVSTEAAAKLFNRTLRQAQKAIERLQRASLVARGTHGLWQMHDLLRLYAAELAKQHDERPGAAERLLRHYVREAMAAAQHIDPRVPPSERGSRFSSRTEAVTWMDVEYPNLLAAVALAEELGTHALLRDLATAMDSYFDLRRQSQDWISVAGAALRACTRLGDRSGEVGVRTSLGNAYEIAGRIHEALEQHEKVLELTRAIADRYMESSALSNMGNAYRSLGDVERAIRLYEESLAIRRELGDRLGEGRTLTNLGMAYRKRGLSSEALSTLRQSLATTIEYYEHDLAISRQLGDQRAEIITLCQLGHASRDLGRLDEAARHYERALAVSRELDDRMGEALALHSLGDLRQDDVLRTQAHEMSHLVVDILDKGFDLLEEKSSFGSSPPVEHEVEISPMCCGPKPVKDPLGEQSP
ncbi:ATP-binding protein [Lentzea sp. E54]|uniref:ATP-binding protein n=1 Tax=Lentzea xerophila TaxID=3435883 RepID=UPI003DA2726C